MATDVAGIYDRLGAGYDRLAGLLDRTGVQRLRADLLARARGDVLEVAVGSGVNLHRYPHDVRLTGLDISAGALLAARARSTVAVVRGDAAALPFGTATADTVVCTLAACTFDDPAVVCAEIRRVLRPDGRALFLEHVRPAGRVGPAVMRAISPLTIRALGCHPDRTTVATIEAAGFATVIMGRAMRGVFVAVEALPRP